MRNRDDINVYINFALYAVLGKLAEADDLLVKHGHAVRRVADYLSRTRPFSRAPLYRGLLVGDGAVKADSRYKFLSWSEDRDVAVWFASTDSVISEHVLEHNPNVRGVLLELPVPRQVLFHHSWALGWERFAVVHPHMGPEGARQIAWSLRTQREVITAPIDLPPAIDVGSIERPTTAELDRRLAPPWIAGGASW